MGGFRKLFQNADGCRCLIERGGLILRMWAPAIFFKFFIRKELRSVHIYLAESAFAPS